MDTIDISVHESQWPSRWHPALAACLRRRAFDSRFHYESPAQTAAWLSLHESHSPARHDPAVARLYPDALDQCLSHAPPPACLASLGCGGGQKDLDVLRKARAPAYAAIDAAAGMVIETLNRIRAALPSLPSRGLVADLSAAKGIASWVHDTLAPKGAILWLAFGVVPNIPATEIPALLRALVDRPGDRLLLGANLISGHDPESEMAAILPQYDNDPTRRWLTLLPHSLGIPASSADIRFAAQPPRGEHPWRIEARLAIQRDCQIDLFGERIALSADEPLLLFFSNRFTPQEIAGISRAAGLEISHSTIAPSGEEGVFELRPKL